MQDLLSSQDSPTEKVTSHSVKSLINGGQPAGSKAFDGKFSLEHRLLREGGFDRVVKAKNISDKNFKVFFARNQEQHARLGIIAGKKNLPRSVDRNRIKRVIREAFRLHSIKNHKLDVVVMVRHVDTQAPDLQTANLGILFSRVEDRCAEL